jgi:nifR3 family TIM-barrel protein
MDRGFWEKLDKPFFILAPMANVTDWAFRQVIMETGRPDVFYTEFLSCDGIVYDKSRFEKELYFDANEHPIVVQFFGSKPENFYKCAQMAVELGFDGIDINMGCPDRSVEKQGAGASLMKNPKLAIEIINETVRGAGGVPVSVKTRLGYSKVETDKWIPPLLDTPIAALTVHGRTRKEMSAVPANWEEIGKVADMAKGSGILVIGNGDVKSLQDGKEKAAAYGLDGIMVGRGIFSNPWLFNPGKTESSPKERVRLLLKHLDNFEKLFGRPSAGEKNRNFDTMKRFFKIYVNDYPGAKELRTKLMETKNINDTREILLSDS